METRMCNKCSTEYPQTSEYFYKRSDGKTNGLRNECKKCNNLKKKKWEVENKERHIETNKQRARKWYKENLTKARLQSKYKSKRQLLKRYDADKSLEELLEEQNNRCAICNIEFKDMNSEESGLTVNSICVDHNHTTNKYRGLLCSHCNLGLGHFKDSPALLEKAMKYVQEKN